MKKALDIAFLIEISSWIAGLLQKKRIPLDSAELSLFTTNNPTGDVMLAVEIETNQNTFEAQKFLCVADECDNSYAKDITRFFQVAKEFIPQYFAAIIACKEIDQNDHIEFEEIRDVVSNDTQSQVLAKTFEKIKEGVYEM